MARVARRWATLPGPGSLLPAAVAAGCRWAVRPWQQRATQTYLTVLAATSLWLSGAHDRLVDAALRTASTNLDGLTRRPITVLLASACWMEPGGWRAAAALAAAALFVMAPVERALGPVRWLLAFLASHVGATVAVAIGLHIGIRAGWLHPALGRSIDVGWSYGALGLSGVEAFVLHGRWRWGWIAGSVAARLLALRNPSFTEVGHALSLAIGLALGPWLAGGTARRDERHRSP